MSVTSIVWGNESRGITQEFGVNLPGIPDSWYAYSAGLGLNYGDHAGIDIDMPRDTPIFAVAGGEVIQAGMSDYFRPKPVWVRTPDDPATPVSEEEIHIYGHLWSNAVNVGDIVARGDYLGGSGEQTYTGTMTPDGSGPHLHFERRDGTNKRALDPVPILDGTGRLGAVSGAPGASGGTVNLGAIAKKAGEGLSRLGIGVAGVALLAFGLVWMLGIDAGDIAGVLPAGRLAKVVSS